MPSVILAKTPKRNEGKHYSGALFVLWNILGYDFGHPGMNIVTVVVHQADNRL
jgi:hypothetical protein